MKRVATEVTQPRVAVTGMAGIGPIGNDWGSIRAHLSSYRNAVVRMHDWADYDGLNTQLGRLPPSSRCQIGTTARRCAVWGGSP
jgi:hypothetical protein